MKRFYSLRIISAIILSAAPAAAQQSAPRTTPVATRGGLPRFLDPVVTGFTQSPGGERSLSTAPDPTLRARLDAALQKAYDSIDPRARRGVQVSVIAPGLGDAGARQWNGTAGYSHGAEPITPTMRFQIGSITKTFVAATIMQLIEEGKLALTDTVGRWIEPHANIDGAVTIRQLLNHSSGIFDYLNNDPMQTLLVKAYFEDPTKHWTAGELLDYVQERRFKPGTSTAYSNTNYLLLGMIVEKITGRSVASEIRRRFLTPLGLENTYCGWEENVEGTYAHPWSTGFNAENDTIQQDIAGIPTTAPLSMANAAGGIVSTAEDVARWSDALYNGKILSKGTMDAMIGSIRNTSEGELGLGLFRYHYYTKTLYGHTGGILGYSSWTFTIPRDTVSVTVLLNSFNPAIDDGMAGIGLALLNEIYRPVSGVTADADAAGTLALEGIYPNPAADRATIRYSIASPAHVTLEIFDPLGSPISTPVDAMQDAGRHEAEIPLTNLPSGAYLYRLHAGDAVVVRTLRVMR